MAPASPPAFFMTDGPERTPHAIAVASNLPHGWGVIYRHFGAADKHAVAVRLVQIAARRSLVLLIAADPSLARSVGAHGVHWPARLLSSRSPNQRFSFETTSAHNRRELIRAAHAGVDAAIYSPVFPSNSPSAQNHIGLMRFISIASAAPLPVYGLGGVTSVNASRITSSRARTIAGFAAVSGIHNAWKS